MDSRKKILLGLSLVALPLCSSAALECYRYNQANQLREAGHNDESQGRILECIAKYEQAIKIYPYFLDLYPELAELYDSTNDLKNSERCWNEAVAKAPADARSQSLMYRMRGTFYFHHEMLALAESDLTQASCLDPSDPLAEQLLTKCREKKQTTAPSPSGSKTSR
ncbi:hypothetical protein JST97_23080 [bacterium]|nr:hypothetical protein [bacterium]